MQKIPHPLVRKQADKAQAEVDAPVFGKGELYAQNPHHTRWVREYHRSRILAS